MSANKDTTIIIASSCILDRVKDGTIDTNNPKNKILTRITSKDFRIVELNFHKYNGQLFEGNINNFILEGIKKAIRNYSKLYAPKLVMITSSDTVLKCMRNIKFDMELNNQSAEKIDIKKIYPMSR
jgi:hypothetical protein